MGRKWWLVLGLVLVAGALAGIGSTPAEAAPAPSSNGVVPQPVGIPGQWDLVFDSEFTGNSLNTAQWSTGWTNPGGEPPQPGITAPVNPGESECYDPRQVTVSGNELRLTAIARQETCGGVARPYASGMVTSNTKFNFTYGAAEARIWLPGAAGGQITDWPAFWLDGLKWPQDGEIDVVEGLGGQSCYHYHSSFHHGAGIGGCAGGTYAGGWHTFATDWEPGQVSFYYDGIKQWTDTSHIASAPLYLILNLAVDPSIGGPNQIPATMKISDVRVWQHPGCASYGCTSGP